MNFLTEEAKAQLTKFGADNPTRLVARDEIASILELEGQTNLAAFLSNYEQPRFVAAGGSGLIFCCTYKPHGTLRALKIPRSRLLKGTDPTEEEDPEVEALSKVSHQNIARMYEDIRVAPGKHIVSSEWIPDAVELQEYVRALCSKYGPDAKALQISGILQQLAERLQEVIDAVDYLHIDAGMYHFDIKPPNLMVSASANRGIAKAYVIDLGLAQDIQKCKGMAEVSVGFTWRYAHTALTEIAAARISEDQNKAKSKIPLSSLGPQYDLFAFGRTIQECLAILESFYREKARTNYYFRFIHLLACLCLDGKNEHTEQWRKSEVDFVEDFAEGCGKDILLGHRFTSASEVSSILRRLLGRHSLEQDCSELDSWYPNTINASDIAFVNLTPRVKRIVVTPVFKRLEQERQLGMLQEVFPTATHSRGNHALGTQSTQVKPEPA